jgi:hypothetical protein
MITHVMTADDVCAFLDLMERRGIRVWPDGGWARPPTFITARTRRSGHRRADVEHQHLDGLRVALQAERPSFGGRVGQACILG